MKRTTVPSLSLLLFSANFLPFTNSNGNESARLFNKINRRLTNSGAHPHDPRHRRQMMRFARPLVSGHAGGLLRQVLRLDYHETDDVDPHVATPLATRILQRYPRLVARYLAPQFRIDGGKLFLGSFFSGSRTR